MNLDDLAYKSPEQLPQPPHYSAWYAAVVVALVVGVTVFVLSEWSGL